MPILKKKFTPIVDTRERTPLILDLKDCNPSIKKKLDTGDYSIDGLESIFCIERKKSVEEIVTNMFESRMSAVITRLSKMKYKAIICEFSYLDVIKFPIGSVVKRKTRVRGPFISSWLNNISIIHNIPIIYAGDASKASYITMQMMKSVWIEWISGS